MRKAELRPDKPEVHTPLRTCLVCMRKRPRRELVRLALEPGGSGRVIQDNKKIMAGRGAYTCPECLRNLRLDKRFHRAFRGAARELCLDRI